MRALVIGRGSMGKRRIRDLQHLGVDVESWDAKDGGPSPLDTCPTGFDFPWQGVVISTPPLTKGNDLLRLIPAFTEADVETWVYPHYPSCTPRFNPGIVRIKERLAAGNVGTPVAYTLHLGQHLVDWHPGADLGTYYAAQRETGACREMVPFELGWLTWLFGPVTKAKALRGSLAGIADIDDVYQVVVEHKYVRAFEGSRPSADSETKVLGHLLIDVVSRPARRHITIVGTAGVIDADIVYTEAVYLAEMRAFVASVEGGAPWPYTLAEEKHCLDVLHMIEQFS